MRLEALLFVSSVTVMAPLAGGCSSDEDGGSPPTPDSGGADAPTGNDGGSDAPVNADTGTDSPSSGGIGPGPYTIVYAGRFAGIDSRSVADGKATFDGFKLTGYVATGQEMDEMPTIGTNTASDVAGSSLFAIGRWGGGTTDGKFYNADAAGKMTFAANGGFQYAIGRPADPIPSSGLTTYTIDKKTAATVSDGSQAPGTITGTLAINLAGATTKIGLSVSIDVPGSGVYTAETTGGVADPSQSEATLGMGSAKGVFYFFKNITNAGGACAGGGACSVNVNGAILGPNAESVIMAVHVFAGAGGSPQSVSGVLAFKK